MVALGTVHKYDRLRVRVVQSTLHFHRRDNENNKHNRVLDVLGVGVVPGERLDEVQGDQMVQIFQVRAVDFPNVIRPVASIDSMVHLVLLLVFQIGTVLGPSLLDSASYSSTMCILAIFPPVWRGSQL